MVALAILGIAGVAAIEDIADRRHTGALISQRESTVLSEVAQRLQFWQWAMEVSAQRLAEQPEIAANVERADQLRVAQILGMLRPGSDLDSLHIYGADGREVTGATDRGARPPLVARALSGRTGSAVTTTANGLEILGAAPIRGQEGVVGAAVVGSAFVGDSLTQLKVREDVDLAVYEGGRLIATTTRAPDVTRLLQDFPASLEQLNGSLEPLNIRASQTPLSGNGLLLTLVPTDDLIVAAWERAAAGVGAISALMAALLLTSLLVARDISRPLRSVVSATAALVQGQYGRRVERSPIRELDDLGGAINSLAQQLEVHVTDLAHQALHDPLTKLPNRSLLLDRLEHALMRAHRDQHPVAVIFLDLDNFKVINDSLGHHIGDQLLIAFTERLRTCLRPGDTAARLGGDEFTVMVEGADRVGDVRGIAERIAERLEAPFHLDGREVFTTVSMGIAIARSRHAQANDLLREADTAMYRAKANGKARYELSNQRMHEDAVKRLDMEADLRRAVERDEFRLYFQPMVLLKTGEIIGAEALIRWEHPQHGLVLPGAFISLAEETGLIGPIQRWVLREACRHARAWQRQLPASSPLIMNANLSPKTLQHPETVDDIAEALRESGLDPTTLNLEITESVMVQDQATTEGAIQGLKQLGVRLVLDDFGTGYSCLAYLKRLPINTLKIDRSFVEGLGQDSENTAIVRAIVTLAKTLNLTVTAEGIETREQLVHLQALECDFGQGYYFAGPAPAEAMDELLTRSTAGITPRLRLEPAPA